MVLGLFVLFETVWLFDSDAFFMCVFARVKYRLAGQIWYYEQVSPISDLIIGSKALLISPRDISLDLYICFQGFCDLKYQEGRLNKYTVFSLIAAHTYKCTVRQIQFSNYCQCTFIHFFIKTFVMDTHLNWLHKSRQFHHVPYVFIKKKSQEKYRISIIIYAPREVLCWNFVKVYPY